MNLSRLEKVKRINVDILITYFLVTVLGEQLVSWYSVQLFTYRIHRVQRN